VLRQSFTTGELCEDSRGSPYVDLQNKHVLRHKNSRNLRVGGGRLVGTVSVPTHLDRGVKEFPSRTLAPSARVANVKWAVLPHRAR